MGNFSNYQHSDLTSEIIKAAYYVHDYFGQRSQHQKVSA